MAENGHSTQQERAALKALLRKLVEAWGPSGREERVADIVQGELAGVMDEVRRDALGNLIAVKKAAPGQDGAKPRKVMISAHMDEIGVIITHVDEKGFLRFGTIGGVSQFLTLGQRVLFADGTVGVFGREKLDHIKDLAFEKMFIDIGASSKEEAEKHVQVGDSGVIQRDMADLGGRVVAKSLDDRIGCVVAIEAARRLAAAGGGPNDVYFVFSAQEEVGLRGAQTAAYQVEPDLGLAVDVTLTGDTPEAPRMEVALGKGAAIKVKDQAIVAHPKVKDLLVAVAEENQIPYQLEILLAGGTDAGAIHLTREGVPSGVISVPCRYVHSPSEMVDLGDVEACVTLLTAVVRKDLAGRF